MQELKKRCTVIVLAAGSGSRMKSSVAKQYMPLGGKPLIWYALNAVEQSKVIDDCILVVSAGDLEYARGEIVEKYGFSKVGLVTAGGAERYDSVGRALQALADGKGIEPNRDGYVFIHDGARPFLTEEILERTYKAVCRHHACVAAMPSKDTVKLADEQGFAASTPDRGRVWSVQTPQVFEARLIESAYARLLAELPRLREQGISITDDAGVVELLTDYKVKLVEGSYENIKLTTPEDIKIAEGFLENK